MTPFYRRFFWIKKFRSRFFAPQEISWISINSLKLYGWLFHQTWQQDGLGNFQCHTVWDTTTLSPRWPDRPLVASYRLHCFGSSAHHSNRPWLETTKTTAASSWQDSYIWWRVASIGMEVWGLPLSLRLIYLINIFPRFSHLLIHLRQHSHL